MNKAPNTNAVVLDIDNLVVGLGKNPTNQRVIDGVSLQVWRWPYYEERIVRRRCRLERQHP